MSTRFIVIEGLIGVGKTSLCRLIAREWGARLVLEPAEDNPFLASFYADPSRFAFPAQMFYLASRYGQQLSLLQRDLFSDLVVSDYIFAKDRLFAEQTLDDIELELYDRFTGLLSGRIPEPDFVVFLDAPTEVIAQRIKRRAIPSEQAIAPAYLDELRERYYTLWSRYRAAPVYVLDTSDRNYVDNRADADWILGLVRGWLDGEPAPDAPAAWQPPARQLTLWR